MESKGDIMVGTMITRKPIIDIRRMYIQGIIIVTRSFHDKFYIVSMGMNTKVQGRLPLLQCITFQFTSWFRRSCHVVILSGVTPVEHNPEKFRGSPGWSKDRYNASGNIYESIRQTSEERGTPLKVEYRGQSRGYDSTKPLRIKGRTQGF